ncbi:hypothetical protein [Candidatus Spongiihabitans sp.]|uniref:hypothetical protein n=1 Tax=Candidatus Spongiihabitans sp. TaxID=3101308 RepID=UPI003C7B42F3
MNQPGDNIVPLKSVVDPPVPASPGGGGGDGRLAAIETRLSALEVHVTYLATKEDIQAIHTTIQSTSNQTLKWLIGVLLSSMIAIAVATLKILA